MTSDGGRLSLGYSRGEADAGWDRGMGDGPSPPLPPPSVLRHWPSVPVSLLICQRRRISVSTRQCRLGLESSPPASSPALALCSLSVRLSVVMDKTDDDVVD